MKNRAVALIVAVAALSGLIAYAVFKDVSKPERHRVDLSWRVPRAVPGVTVAAYNVYRSTTPKGPYVRLATGVKDLKYTDWLVSSGRTYYYVVTSVDTAGRESRYSGEIRAIIP